MDWIKRLNQAIDFIEKNLDGELDYEDVKKKMLQPDEAAAIREVLSLE